MVRERERALSQTKLSLLGAAHHCLLPARLADLVGADPLTLDRPGAKALVVGVVASEVAVLDQTSTSVSAMEVDDFELSSNQQRLPSLRSIGYAPYLTHYE